MSTVHLPLRRAEDGRLAFPWRPVIVELDVERYVLPAMDTQLLLTELRRLPAGRYPLAANVTESVARGLSKGTPVAFSGEGVPTLLRAVEGVRARRSLPAGLRPLREALLRRIAAETPAGRSQRVD
jgi:hypothetical protein